MKIELTIAASLYGLGQTEWKLVKSYCNYIFESEHIILQITPADYKTAEELAIEVAWIAYLNKNGLEVVKVIPSLGGSLLEVQQGFSVICYERIVGKKVNREYWGEAHFFKLGQLTGKLHQLGTSFAQQYAYPFSAWDEIPKAIFVDLLPVDHRNLVALYHRLVGEFQTYTIRTDNYGLIHYDIHHGNYFLRGEKEQLILYDFEMTCTSWYVNEIAVILYYILNAVPIAERAPIRSTFLRAFFEGYQVFFAIEEREKEKIPKFLLYRDLLVYAFTFRMWKDKEELTQGEAKFRNRIKDSIEVRRKKLGL